jgi:autotransporter-associated beta strand protein
MTKAGAGRVTLTRAENIATSGAITIAQGILAAPYGLPLGGEDLFLDHDGTLEAAGYIPRPISGTGTITAMDDLLLGRSSRAGQCNLGGSPSVGGTLDVDDHAVILLSADAAILGSLTRLDDGGSLTTLHGAQLGNASSLDFTKILLVAGNATVNGDFINNGAIHGPGAVGQWLTFTQDVTGAGSTTGNILFAGSYSPGNSPAFVSVERVAFDPTSTLVMEIGGPIAGGEYDQLDVSGLATLHGTLDVRLLDGYALDFGRSYQLLDGPTSGRFDQVVGLPRSWHVDYSAQGVSLAAPEPSTLILFGVGAVALLAFAGRRRTA